MKNVFYPYIRCLAILALVVLPQAGTGQVLSTPTTACAISGYIDIDTVWSPTDCDPYVVTSDTYVQSGVILTILPGTRVKFNYSISLTVDGMLVARGSPRRLITFTSAAPNPVGGDWNSIWFTDSSVDATYDPFGQYTGGSAIQYAVVNYGGGSSSPGALVTDAASPYLDHIELAYDWSPITILNGGQQTITNNTIHNTIHGSGIYVYSSDPVEIAGNRVADNDNYGIYCQCSNALTLSHNLVKDNDQGGIYYAFSCCDTSSLLSISGNVIAGNPDIQGVGMYVSLIGGGQAAIEGNTITGYRRSGRGGGMALYPSACCLVTLRGNVISGNTADQGGGVAIESGSSVPVEVTGNTITQNIANYAEQGGGIFLQNGSQASLTENALYGNWTGSLADIPNDLYNFNDASQPVVNAVDNYWGTSRANEIGDVIWDQTDDPALGVVTYTPYLTHTVGNILVNPGFEFGPGAGWNETSTGQHEVITSAWPHLGAYSAHLCGYNDCTDTIEQRVTIPDGAWLRYSWYVSSSEETVNAHDILQVEARTLAGEILATLRVWSNVNRRNIWHRDALFIGGAVGQTILLRFTATTDPSRPTLFTIDDVSIQ